VNASDPTGAVIDIDGNGKLDAEESQTQHYTSLPSGPAGSRAGARRYAAHLAMATATRAAVAGLNARAVSNLASLEFDAAPRVLSGHGRRCPSDAGHDQVLGLVAYAGARRSRRIRDFDCGRGM